MAENPTPPVKNSTEAKAVPVSVEIATADTPITVATTNDASFAPSKDVVAAKTEEAKDAPTPISAAVPSPAEPVPEAASISGTSLEEKTVEPKLPSKVVETAAATKSEPVPVASTTSNTTSTVPTLASLAAAVAKSPAPVTRTEPVIAEVSPVVGAGETTNATSAAVPAPTAPTPSTVPAQENSDNAGPVAPAVSSDSAAPLVEVTVPAVATIPPPTADSRVPAVDTTAHSAGDVTAVETVVVPVETKAESAAEVKTESVVAKVSETPAPTEPSPADVPAAHVEVPTPIVPVVERPIVAPVAETVKESTPPVAADVKSPNIEVSASVVVAPVATEAVPVAMDVAGAKETVPSQAGTPTPVPASPAPTPSEVANVSDHATTAAPAIVLPPSPRSTPPQSPTAASSSSTTERREPRAAHLALPLDAIVTPTPPTTDSSATPHTPKTAELVSQAVSTPRAFAQAAFNDWAMDTPAGGPMPMSTHATTTPVPMMDESMESTTIVSTTPLAVAPAVESISIMDKTSTDEKPAPAPTAPAASTETAPPTTEPEKSVEPVPVTPARDSGKGKQPVDPDNITPGATPSVPTPTPTPVSTEPTNTARADVEAPPRDTKLWESPKQPRQGKGGGPAQGGRKKAAAKQQQQRPPAAAAAIEPEEPSLMADFQNEHAADSLSHLFVIRGDLRQIACDAWMCPANPLGEVAPYWELDKLGFTVPAIPPQWASRECLVLPCGEWRATGGQPWIANTAVGRHHQLDNIVNATRAFIAEAATFLKSNNHPPAFWRERHLLCVPLAGTGYSRATEFAGEVVGRVLPVIVDTAREHQVDVCLATDKPVIYAAVQAWRARSVDRPLSASFAALSREERQQAEVLAELAKRGDLVLFLGAGVSAGCGLPLWGQLLTALGEKARLTADDWAKLKWAQPVDVARLLAGRLTSAGLSAAICDNLKTPYYSLTHGLLACLPVNEAVTTNYEQLYERACQASGAATAVLPYAPNRQLSRWLCKMHGCVTKPETIVLTREEYMGYLENRGTLAGIVESLLLTKHMLFVGFSLNDENFHKIAREVRKSMKKREREGAGVAAPVVAGGGAAAGAAAAVVLDTPTPTGTGEGDLSVAFDAMTHSAAAPVCPVIPTDETPLPTTSAAAATATPPTPPSVPHPLKRAGSTTVAQQFIGTTFGTSLALQDDAILTEMWKGDVNVVAMGAATASIPLTARRLQIFLDYLLLRSTTMTNFLLNPRFEGLLGEKEAKFAAHVMRQLVDVVPEDLQRLPAWRPIAQWLISLGLNIAPPAPQPLALAAPGPVVIGGVEQQRGGDGAEAGAATARVERGAAAAPEGPTLHHNAADQQPAAAPVSPGHVFIVQGNLKQMACDHWLLPTGYELSIPRRWVGEPFPPEKRQHTRVAREEFRCVEVPGQSTIWPFSVEPNSLQKMFRMLQEFFYAVARVCKQHPQPRDGRARHLIALPVIGTGYSGRANQSAEIIGGLLPILYHQAHTHGFDVVLVAFDETTYDACQEHRRRMPGYDLHAALRPFPQLQETMVRMAAAARGQSLVMIVGSALSAGQESISQMMDRYVEANHLVSARELRVFRGMPAVDKATLIAQRDGGLERFRREMVTDLSRTAERASLAHVQLASLDASMIITTSADTVLESYFTSLKQRHCVLPYDKADSNCRWILKMCGDPRARNDIPLTRADLDSILSANSANMGMVHALVTTRDAFICGMDFKCEADARFLHTVRANLPAESPTKTVLVTDAGEPLLAALWRPQLDVFSLANEPVNDNVEEVSAAEMRRRQEILFDTLLAEVAAESFSYLLDKRFHGKSGPEVTTRFLSGEERALGQIINSFVASLPKEVYKLPAYRLLRKVVVSLGGHFDDHGGYQQLAAQERHRQAHKPFMPAKGGGHLATSFTSGN